MGYYTRGEDGKPELVKGERRIPRKTSRLPNYKLGRQAEAKAKMAEAGAAQAEAAASKPVVRRPFMRQPVVRRPVVQADPLPPHPVPGLLPSPTPPPEEPAMATYKCLKCGGKFQREAGKRGRKPTICKACGWRDKAPKTKPPEPESTPETK
jgi:DNA-directed RNA polymerase subunit RPC12/RpoP